VCIMLFLSWDAGTRDLHSFPTRRSSDLPQRRTSGLSQINADGEKHLIRERRVVERLGQHGRQDVQRKQMSAGDVFESEQDEYERSEEHTSELQSPCNLVCRLLLEKKKQT